LYIHFVGQKWRNGPAHSRDIAMIWKKKYLQSGTPARCCSNMLARKKSSKSKGHLYWCSRCTGTWRSMTKDYDTIYSVTFTFIHDSNLQCLQTPIGITRILYDLKGILTGIYVFFDTLVQILFSVAVPVSQDSWTVKLPIFIVLKLSTKESFKDVFLLVQTVNRRHTQQYVLRGNRLAHVLYCVLLIIMIVPKSSTHC